MIEIRKISSSDTAGAFQAMAIREAVFVREQGVDPLLEHDTYESVSHHYLALFNGSPVGTARWRKTGKGIKLERFAVLTDYRNRGIGEKLLNQVLDDACSEGHQLYLHAQLRAVPFYERAGFSKEGDLFYEAGLAHYRMTRSCSHQP